MSFKRFAGIGRLKCSKRESVSGQNPQLLPQTRIVPWKCCTPPDTQWTGGSSWWWRRRPIWHCLLLYTAFLARYCLWGWHTNKTNYHQRAQSVCSIACNDKNIYLWHSMLAKYMVHAILCSFILYIYIIYIHILYIYIYDLYLLYIIIYIYIYILIYYI